MKKTFKRIFQAGWTNFKRNSYISFGTTGVMTLVLLLFTGLIVISYVSDHVISDLKDKVDVTAYFKQEASEDQIMSVKEDLAGQPEVAAVTYVSRDDALNEFKARHAGDALIQESLAELSDNPLQASLNIKANDSSQYATIVNFLEGNDFRPIVDKINFYENEAVIGRVESISNGVRNWGLLGVLILSAIAVLVTFNTIRLTIYNQRQEIEIMRLVGGSTWHIKAPFLIEGGLYGIFAAILATVIFYPTLWFASSKAAALIPDVNLMGYFLANAGEFVGIIAAAGVALGVVSSFIAIRRFLKV
ncbi:MAG TPA: permease-like cell division protein FtsX [Candidatus Paceibacterota bacterium]|nr:permease-like cell division protein FtsX [Candidatus Paceibacterota bacterium]